VPGEGLAHNWQLRERVLPAPFEKGALYDFTEEAQAEIGERLAEGEAACEWVAVAGERLVGLLDAEHHRWNNTVFLWNLMLDLDYRRQGIGRRLWAVLLDYGRAISARGIMIETQNTNVAACAFYAAAGCRLVGINEAYYITPPGAQPEVALFWFYKFV
jgi:ribosomal protein S18 acetylase RimI-like enzyme